MRLTSTAFDDGVTIPKRFTCDGAEASPPLAIADRPARTRELALVVEDRDADQFVHWTVLRIAPDTAVIAANHGVDIVPIYVSGTHDAMPPGQNWPERRRGKLFPRRHNVEVRFGEPIAPRDPTQRREVMAEVQAFWERKGLPEDGRDPSEIHDVLLIHEVLRIHEEAAGRERTGRFDKVIPLAPETIPDQPSPAA